ncbi:MFS transporter [Methylobacillus methanolivorans]
MSTSLPSPQDDYLLGRSKTLRIFSLFCLLMIFDFADRMVIAAVLPQIKATWQLSDAQSGMLGSALFMCMVLFAFPASFLIDNWSRTKTAGLMGGLWSLASGAGAFVVSFPHLLVTRALVGVGEAGYLPAALAWLSSAFPFRRKQLATGILLSSQSVGTLSGLILGGFIASHFGWRYALGLLALPGLLVAWLVYFSKDFKNSTQSLHTGQAVPAARVFSLHDAWAKLRLVLHRPSLWIMFLALSAMTLSAIPLQYFMPTFFNRVHGVPLQQAAYISSAIILCSAIAGPVGGWFLDRRAQIRPASKFTFAITAFLSTALIYLLVFGVVEGLGTRLGLMMLATFVNFSIISMVMTVTQELVPSQMRAFSSTCCIVTAHLLGSVPGPWLAGLLSDAYGLTHALLFMTTSCSVLAATVLLVAKRFYTRDFERTAEYRTAVAEVHA